MLLTAETLTVAWMVIFFFASSAASAAYLTVSETFPLEIRALAIAFFYAVGTGIGGVAGPLLFGALIETGSRASVFAGYLFGAALMLGAAVVAALWSVAAERRAARGRQPAAGAGRLARILPTGGCPFGPGADNRRQHKSVLGGRAHVRQGLQCACRVGEPGLPQQ